MIERRKERKMKACVKCCATCKWRKKKGEFFVCRNLKSSLERAHVERHFLCGFWEDKYAEKKCPGCKGPVKEGQNFCTNCGLQINPNITRCECGFVSDTTDQFCRKCGHSLSSASSSYCAIR
jgi:hypothetical protein